MPILMVWPCASAGRLGVVVSATAATSASTSAMRIVFIERHLRTHLTVMDGQGSRQKWLTLAHVVGQYHPLAALTTACGAHGSELARDAEVTREPSLDL